MHSSTSTTMEYQTLIGRLSEHPRTRDEDSKYPCDYKECLRRYDREDDLKAHMKHAENHFYCKRCDFVGNDWEHLTEHKVAAMAPFIHNETKDPPRHIVCEFCGEEFRSTSGRKKHRAQSHPAEQNVKCPGCDTAFVRAAHMIDHLEQGKCKMITQYQFYANMQQKFIVRQFIEAPDKIREHLNANRPQLPDMHHLKQLGDGSESLDFEEGGVPLIDQHDEAQMGGYKPMEPERNLIDLDSPPSKTQAPWLAFSKARASDITNNMRSMSINSRASSTTTKTSSAGDSEVNSPSLSTASVARTASVWSGGAASKALFPRAQPTPMAGDWRAILAKKEEEAANDNTNLFKARFWDKYSRGYDPEIYWRPLEQKYCCPFPACENDNACYDTHEEIEEHIMIAHLRRIFACSICFRRFDRAGALIGHMENTDKCGIRQSAKFKKLVDDITGGFLKASRVAEEKIYHWDMEEGQALVKRDSKVSQPQGVMSTRFTGQAPY